MESPATSVERFGPRVELFTTSNTPVYAGFALGGLFAAVGLGVSGCGLAQFPDVQTDRLAGGRFISGVIGGPLLFLLGAVGVWYARSLRGTGVEVCANGLREWPVVPGKSGGVLWGEVDRIEEHYVYDKVPMKMGGLLLTQTFRQFVVFPRTGPALAYDYTGIARINRLGKKLRAAAETNAIPWKVVGKPEEGGGVWEG